MADRSNSIQEHLNKDPKAGQELADINITQGMVKSTLDQQSANLQIAKESSSSQETNNTELRSALELAADTQGSQGTQLPPQAANLSPQTQEILSKYGVNPNITESKTSSSSTSRSGSTRTLTEPGGKVTNTTTINNVTNNNVRTETNIETSAPSPSVTQTPVIQQSDNTPKFKAWLTGIFSRRDNENKIKDREFRRREYSLSRTTDKLMRRMEEVSRKFAEKVNPDNIGRTFMNQLKLFATLFISTMLPKVWEPMMKGISTISDNFMDLLGKGKGESFIGKIKRDIFGIEPGKNVTFTQAISHAFGVAINGIKNQLSKIGKAILPPLKEWFDSIMEDRRVAIKAAHSSAPDIKLNDPSSWVSYLGDILSAAFGGTEVVKNKVAKNEVEKGDKEVTSKFKKLNALDEKGNIDMSKSMTYDPKSIDHLDAANSAYRRFVEDNRDKYPKTNPKSYTTIGKGMRYNNGSNASKDFLKKDENGISPYDIYMKEEYEKRGAKTKMETVLNSILEENKTNSQEILALLSKLQNYNKNKDVEFTLGTLTKLGIPSTTLYGLIRRDKGLYLTPDTNNEENGKIKFTPGSLGSLAKLISGTDNFDPSYDNLLGIEIMRNGYLNSKNAVDYKGISSKIEGYLSKLAGKGLKSNLWGPLGILSYLGGAYLDNNEDNIIRKELKSGYSSLPENVLDVITHLNSGGQKVDLSDTTSKIWDNLQKTYQFGRYSENKSSSYSSSGSYIGSTDENLRGRSTKGVKNNNPGNIMDYNYYKSTGGDFRVNSYSSLEEGYASMISLLTRYINGQKFGEKLDTLVKVLNKWAPREHGNDPDAYSNFVSSQTGIGVNDVIDPNNEELMKSIALAMTKMEHGINKVDPSVSEDIDKGWNRFKGVTSGDESKIDEIEANNNSNEVNIPGVSKINPDGTINNSSGYAFPNLFNPPSEVEYNGPLRLNGNLPMVDKENSREIKSANSSTDTNNESEKESNSTKTPVVIAPQTNNTGGNTVINNNIYNKGLSKTNDALYGR